MIHLTWKFPFWLFERCSFLILWLLILLVLCIYFNWEKCFADRIWLKSMNSTFHSKSIKLNVEIMKLLNIFIRSYYSWYVFAFQATFSTWFLKIYLNACALLQKWSICLMSDMDFCQMKINKFNPTRNSIWRSMFDLTFHLPRTLYTRFFSHGNF